MRPLKRVLRLEVLMVIGILLLLSQNSYAWWVANSSESSFPGGGEEGTGIEQYIVDGAGYFLEAHANVLLYMKKIEWEKKEGLNYQELKSLLDTAMENMEKARQAYVNLSQAADNTPYDMIVIEKLKNFNYDEFQEAHALNPVVFAEVKSILANGNVRKVYHELLLDFEGIIELLKSIKGQVDAGIFPSVHVTRKLSQSFSNALLLGQYVAHVFDCILNN